MTDEVRCNPETTKRIHAECPYSDGPEIRFLKTTTEVIGRKDTWDPYPDIIGGSNG
jgi:hypothetical protein